MGLFDRLKKKAESKNIAVRCPYTFVGNRAMDSATYYDTVISHGYTGDMDFLAWDAAHKFGMKVVSDNLSSFRNGLVFGLLAKEAASHLDDEYKKAYAGCEEFGRSKKMQELMSTAYEETKKEFNVEIVLL